MVLDEIKFCQLSLGGYTGTELILKCSGLYRYWSNKISAACRLCLERAVITRSLFTAGCKSMIHERGALVDIFNF